MRIAAFLLGVFVGGLLLLGVGGGFLLTTSPRFYTVLVVGSDQRGAERARSDVLFVITLPSDPAREPLFLTIPRDTKIDHPEYGLQKIAHFYALGDRLDDTKLLGNVGLTKEVVETLLDIPIDATIEVTFQSFEELIDIFEGVILEGQRITGAEALAIVRDRFTQGRSDFDRQKDARLLFRSLLTKVKNPTRIRAVKKYFSESPQARLQYDKRRLARFLLRAGIRRKGRITIGTLREEVLPGHGERIDTPAFGKALYYWVVDDDALQRLLDEYFE